MEMSEQVVQPLILQNDRIRWQLANVLMWLIPVSVWYVVESHDVGVMAIATAMAYGVRQVYKFYFSE